MCILTRLPGVRSSESSTSRERTDSVIATQGETEELSASWRKRALFEREARPHLEFLRAQARRLTRSDADADDLAQDTLVRASLYFDRYEEGTHFKAWLLQIANEMGTPIGTVMSRLHRARKELQAALREQAEQLGVIAEGARLPIAMAR